jgi:molybdenum-dependent DNA-binding transcriptional regulator ModE
MKSVENLNQMLRGKLVFAVRRGKKRTTNTAIIAVRLG